MAAGVPGRSSVVADARRSARLIGLAQGWFIAYEGIPAFIVTLAGLSILRGFALC